ncbi:hypothetical protein SJI19_15135 [Acerihabitans sp. TG2]|uniref:hypothetical protein n=1 Tax=Acerihabitans sp. TG2 TaxID=3096008 RepID=UPI002B22D43C|nr:hypothetical protein [Acerihabitans sp. TG2]MEA9391861.1 hypothetical protein [Acerihabitans sp. TG2]
MKKAPFYIAFLTASIVLSGCSSLGFGPGSKPSSTAPKITTPPGQKQYWDNASLFGPVPTEYQAEGNEACQTQGNKKAIGYYPNPKKYDGTYFGKRGYLCTLY